MPRQQKDPPEHPPNARKVKMMTEKDHMPLYKFIGVCDYPYYPYVSYFETREEADSWFDKKISEKGTLNETYIVAEILRMEEFPTG